MRRDLILVAGAMAVMFWVGTALPLANTTAVRKTTAVTSLGRAPFAAANSTTLRDSCHETLYGHASGTNNWQCSAQTAGQSGPNGRQKQGTESKIFFGKAKLNCQTGAGSFENAAQNSQPVIGLGQCGTALGNPGECQPQWGSVGNPTGTQVTLSVVHRKYVEANPPDPAECHALDPIQWTV